MGMQINNNLMANNALRNVNNTQDALGKSLEKLSSGMRINRASDDAAGLSISEGLRSQVSGLGVAQRNAQDGMSVIGVAEGALTEVHTILHRQRDLAVQAGNDSNNIASRAAIKTESDALSLELTRISATTNFNGTKLLDTAKTLTFQVGAGSVAAEDTIGVTTVNVADVATATAALTFDTSTNALASVAEIDDQIAAISAGRSGLGASQNRLESASRSLAVAKENLGAAESRIRDTDMAAEMVNYTKANILQQAGVSMLSQANQSGQSVLKLLG